MQRKRLKSTQMYTNGSSAKAALTCSYTFLSSPFSMSKLLTGQASSHVTCQTCQFKTVAHLKSSKIQVIAEESEHPVQTVTLVEVTPSDISLEIYSSVKDFENKNIQDQ